MHKKILRIGLAVWLGVLALAANVLEQQQLTGSILAAATQAPADVSAPVPAGFHRMPDGTLMAGVMPHASAAQPAPGHTHQGHADCALCGAVAAMAAFHLPVLPLVPPPPVMDAGAHDLVHAFTLASASAAAYSSRAPPVTI